jgi:hypothetical protein
MADDGDAMASSLLESLGDEELLRVLAEGFSRQRSVPEAAAVGADDQPKSQQALVASIVHVILERSFPALATEAGFAAIESDVTAALLAHEQSMRRIERLASALRARDPRGGGRT